MAVSSSSASTNRPAAAAVGGSSAWWMYGAPHREDNSSPTATPWELRSGRGPSGTRPHPSSNQIHSAAGSHTHDGVHHVQYLKNQRGVKRPKELLLSQNGNGQSTPPNLHYAWSPLVTYNIIEILASASGRVDGKSLHDFFLPPTIVQKRIDGR